MVSVSYTPKYNHPVTQHDLNKLEPEILTNGTPAAHVIPHTITSLTTRCGPGPARASMSACQLSKLSDK